MTEPLPPTGEDRGPEGERSRAPRAGRPAAEDQPHHLLVQAPVPPLDVDGFRVTILGLVAFAVATAVTAYLYPQLQREGNGWWLGVCVSGFALGLVGLAYCLHRRRQRRAGHWDRD